MRAQRASPSFQLDREKGVRAWVQAGALPYLVPGASYLDGLICEMESGSNSLCFGI